MTYALPVDPERYAAFLGVMAVLAVTPGPANLFSIANGMARGRRAVVVGVLGMSLATLVWFTAAALGLGALVLAFPAAFRVIAVGGALYVAWLGGKALWGAVRGPKGSEVPGRPERPNLTLGRSAFFDGFMVQLANPKAVLFFTAVLPPFLDLGRPLGPQLALFALATIGMDMITMNAYGLGGAALARRMTAPGFRRGFDAAVGVLLLAAAVLIGLRL
ncbi:LysE family translocator [Brevundimonas halotolerans]|uniref:Threonine/homoserine/homoserine lactone efflux protein n=1 Tax=Brevundimonas halotolerans TaxID=69670 RepID=A0A7W9A2Y0_9CAUL|nr:LysE family translocator [Brevundimonas halotolerans]MBB5660419.1 threonine/homoserine/homoserine lactone efflux protein [Brevundimonas halotolerans]